MPFTTLSQAVLRRQVGLDLLELLAGLQSGLAVALIPSSAGTGLLGLLKNDDEANAVLLNRPADEPLDVFCNIFLARQRGVGATPDRE